MKDALDDYFSLKSDDQVIPLSNWNTHITKEKVEVELKYIHRHLCYKAICLLLDQAIGFIRITQGEGYDGCRAEIGYFLASMQWGQGIATQAVKMVVSGIFEKIQGLERVEALIDVENVRSHRVVEKAGFVKEGVFKKYWLLKGRARDMVVYSLLGPEGQVLVHLL